MGGFGMFRDNLLVLPSDMGRGEGTVLSSLNLIDVVDVADCILGDLHLILLCIVVL
jgi:hypothetical protein